MQTVPRGIPKLITVGVIADELGQPLHRVLRVLRTRRIHPVALAGRVRLFETATIARVRHEINAIDARTHREGDPYGLKE